MTKTKKQHYISQFYLRNFSENKEKIFCVVKPEMNITYPSIKDTAEENYFYDLKLSEFYETSDEETRKQIDDSCMIDKGKTYNELTQDERDNLDQFLENYLSTQIETPLGIIIKKIIDNTYDFNKWVVKYCLFMNEDEKHEMAFYLAITYIRSKSYRSFISKSLENMYKGTIPRLASLQGIDIKEEDLNISFTKEAQKANHIKAIVDENEGAEIAGALFSKKWVLYENLTEIPFVTSDEAFVIVPTEKPPFPIIGNGLASPGVMLFYPISSRLLLVMYDSIKFSFMKDRHIEVIEEKNRIIDANLAIISNAFNYVYACNRELANLVVEWSNMHPEIKEKNIKMIVMS